MIPSVADDTDDFTPRPVALRKIARRQQDRVIHYPRDLRRRRNRLYGDIQWMAVDVRALRPERAACHRRSVVGSAVSLDLVQSRGQLLANGGKVCPPAHSAAIVVDANF